MVLRIHCPSWRTDERRRTLSAKRLVRTTGPIHRIAPPLSRRCRPISCCCAPSLRLLLRGFWHSYVSAPGGRGDVGEAHGSARVAAVASALVEALLLRWVGRPAAVNVATSRAAWTALCASLWANVELDEVGGARCRGAGTSCRGQQLSFDPPKNAHAHAWQVVTPPARTPRAQGNCRGQNPASSMTGTMATPHHRRLGVLHGGSLLEALLLLDLGARARVAGGGGAGAVGADDDPATPISRTLGVATELLHFQKYQPSKRWRPWSGSGCRRKAATSALPALICDCHEASGRTTRFGAASHAGLWLRPDTDPSQRNHVSPHKR